MVGIILATHGNFATGIQQSASMIFGEQPNVAAVTLQPNEGPDDVRKKMEEAVASFEDPQQVLILVIDAYASRMMMDTAQELAVQISGSAKEGVKIYPESLEPKEEKKAAATSDGQPKGVLPEGTVVGDGKIKYVLARIDSRLLHGQVATAWTKTTGPNRIIVVSDGVAHDDLRKSMIREAAPPGVKANVVPVSKMIQVAKDTRFGNTKALLLFETPQDALAAIKGGVDIKELNIGSMAHSVGKVAVSKVLSLDEKDIETFEELKKLGVKFDVRKVPSDSQDNMDEILKKAKAELAK